MINIKATLFGWLVS